MSDKGLDDRGTQPHHAAHRWMMLACIPAILIVGILAAAGATGGATGAMAASFALVCVGMMVGMMVMMTMSRRH